MRSPRLAAAGVLLLGAALLAPRAEAQTFHLERRGESLHAVVPGAMVTVPFLLTTTDPDGAEVTLEGVAPGGIRTVLGAGSRRVTPGEGELVLVGVRVPAGTPAGEHVIRLLAHGAGGSAVDSVRVRVGARRRVEAEVAAAPGFVAAGERYGLRLRVRNAGNAPERLVLTARGDRGAAPDPAVTALELAPGEVAELSVAVDTRPIGARNVHHQVRFEVAAADGDPAVSAVARTLVEVVPGDGGRARTGAPAPAELRFRATDRADRVGIETRGRGRLLGADVHLHARSADPRGTPFARREELVLRLVTPALELRAGHGIYGHSGISGPLRYGVGGSAAVERGVLRGGAFAGGSMDGVRMETLGAFLRAGGSSGGAGLSVERARSERARPGGVAVEGWLRPGRSLHATGEVAVDEGGAPPRRLAAWGSISRLDYDLLHLRPRAGIGTTAGVDAARMTLRPHPGVAFLAAYRRGVEWRPDTLPPELVHLPAEHARVRLELGARLLHVELGRQRSAPPWSREHTAARLGGRLRLGLLRVEPAVARGTATGADRGRAPYRMEELRAGGWGRRVSLSGVVRREEGWGGAALPGTRWTTAVDGAATVVTGTRARFSAGGVREVGVEGVSGFADLTVEQSLHGGHVVALRAVAHRARGFDTAPRVQLEYRLPLSVPVGPGPEGVAVTVIDAATGRGVEGALVRVGGRTARTGRGGRALVREVPVGAHPVRVERAHSGAPWIVDPGAPPVAEVGGDGRTRVRVEVAEGGALEGRVLRVPAGAGGAEPLPGVELVLLGPGPEVRVVTGVDGRYRFEGVWPGWWRLRFASETLPRHHDADEPAGHFHIRPREVHRAELRVVERERPVRYIDGGELSPAR